MYRPIIGCMVSAALIVTVGGWFPGKGRGAGAIDGSAKACASLAGMVIPAARIALPTKGARITSASLVRTIPAKSGGDVEFCRTIIAIFPVDPKAQPVGMQLNLPSAWNGKAVQIGGGGFDGILTSGEDPLPGAPAEPTALVRGYVTFGSDGGHRVSDPFDIDGQAAAFTNDEVLRNFGGDQLKKAHDVANAVIQRRYGRRPSRIYFAGASGGGREALIAIQRWGGDYDGAISYYPALGGSTMIAAFGRLSRTFAAPGAYVGPAEQQALNQAVMSSCDELDGVKDGIIANPRECRFDVRALRCSTTGRSAACLTDTQIRALDVVASPIKSVAGGAQPPTTLSGYDVYHGIDIARYPAFGEVAPTSRPIDSREPLQSKFYDMFVRGWLLRDLSANALGLDPQKLGRLRGRWFALSKFLQPTRFDFSDFKSHGGKLILVHGNDDALIPVGWTIGFYQRLIRKMGASTVTELMRFYLVPGYGHGRGIFAVDWDSLSALDIWVESGKAPSQPVVKDVNPSTWARSRPLCIYPSWPRYRGSGDVNDAGSFACVTRVSGRLANKRTIEISTSPLGTRLIEEPPETPDLNPGRDGEIGESRWMDKDRRVVALGLDD